MKIWVVIGTRPDVIKLAPVIHELKRDPECDVTVVSSAQHRELLDQMCDIFDITPDIDLDVMKENQHHLDVALDVSQKLSSLLKEASPEWLIVQGDTTTALMAGLTAYYCGVPVAHVEAGLRTHHPILPYPEEKNRVLLSDIASLHFAPTVRAVQNLIAEGCHESRIYLTGNTIVDALMHILPKAQKLPIQTSPGSILITLHRREIWGEPLRQICLTLAELAKSVPDIPFVYPVHPNPGVQNIVYDTLGHIPNVSLVKPFPYPHLVRWLADARFVMTDSGGIQEEACTLKKPVLVLRDVTERPELIEAGYGILVGTDPMRIREGFQVLLHRTQKQPLHTPSPDSFSDIYGDGKASVRIRNILKLYPFEHIRFPKTGQSEHPKT